MASKRKEIPLIFTILFFLSCLFFVLNLIGISLNNPLLHSSFKIIMAIILPLSIIFLLWSWPALKPVPSPVKGIVTIFLVLALVICFFLNILTLKDTYTYGYNPFLEPIQKLKINNNRSVTVYRTNGGATTDFGILIVQNENVLPGVSRSIDLAHYYHLQDVDVERISETQIRILGITSTTHFYDKEDVKRYGSLPVEGDLIDLQ